MPRLEEVTDGPLLTTPAATAISIAGGQAYVADVARRLAPYFARAQSRQRVRESLCGLLSEAERKHSWHVAAVCGAPTPDGCPDVLNRADWDADAACDALRTSVIQPLEDPNGVLVLDATGCVKTGRHSAGVARQDTGTVGTGEHGHMGVFRG